jgi:hypothetical protein
MMQLSTDGLDTNAATARPRLYLLPSLARPRRTLSPRAGYAVAVLVVGPGLFASVTPSPLYRTYSVLWHFSPLTLTLISATALAHVPSRSFLRAITGVFVISPRQSSGVLARLVRYQPLGAEEWKLDISLLPAGTTWRSGATLGESLRDGLTDETRVAILRLKDIWHRLPTYRYQVASTDIYDAVLTHGVRTPEAFDAYLRQRGKPDRFTWPSDDDEGGWR